ncbi:hypothetical protein BXZ70DRAFT_1062885 [Cristinia sonorae]|uniref:Sld7 C-terminal domain-containing protein n=1 Tax=Cristinia sonorae TaxID=1940300 RepID=A0A8K0UUE8_9AGAR|nr:hypothetical protein BXZ70DRAFT_1062885 [Cristinia sonorae]
MDSAVDTHKHLAHPPSPSPSKTQTPSRKPSPNTHRLLYRGSLALPDSHILLDGLSFTTDIASTNSPSASLLENPLALALESMRGRPLHFKGTEKLDAVWLDASIDIKVYVHEYSTITQIYFENTFCLSPIASPNRRTPLGIRVGPSDTSSTDDFIIYGELRASSATTPSTSSSPPPKTLTLLASRILPHPPPRLPRPDDPTPRKPPAYLSSSSTAAKRKRDLSNASLNFGDGAKRAKGKGKAGEKEEGEEEDEQVRMAREVMLHGPKKMKVDPGVSLPRLLGRDARPGKNADRDTFKVPAVPTTARSQSVLSQTEKNVDVFGTVETGFGGSSGKEKEKEKEKAGSDELEKANKTVIKQAAMTCLAEHGIRKGHPEFSEVFSATYRGAAFALRNVIRVQAVNMRVVDRLLESHARIYVSGNGENHVGDK